jgi:hypothetical protein
MKAPSWKMVATTVVVLGIAGLGALAIGHWVSGDEGSAEGKKAGKVLTSKSYGTSWPFNSPTVTITCSGKSALVTSGATTALLLGPEIIWAQPTQDVLTRLSEERLQGLDKARRAGAQYCRSKDAVQAKKPPSADAPGGAKTTMVVHQDDFGTMWPFGFSQATVSCLDGVPVLTAEGRDYSLLGKSPNTEPIAKLLKDSKAGDAETKLTIRRLIFRAESLC